MENQFKITKSTVEQYKIRHESGMYWADIVLDHKGETGRIQIASDYGSWQNYWGSCGCSFKEFLTRIDMWLYETMKALKEKIINHAKTEYSSPYEFDEEQIKLIIEHDCECDHCGKSVFELYDFPEVSVERKEVLCEECYEEEYRTVCPLCEGLYENDEMTNYFFITKATSKTVRKPIGMYEILEYPFYYGDCVTGFDSFFDDAIRKVSDMNIDEAYSILNPLSNKDILLDCICPCCAEKYLRKDNFINADSLYCILQEKQRNQLFANYSDETIHRFRQDMIHRRITFRGILKACNK